MNLKEPAKKRHSVKSKKRHSVKSKKRHTPWCKLLVANDTTLILGLTCSCPDAEKEEMPCP